MKFNFPKKAQHLTTASVVAIAVSIVFAIAAFVALVVVEPTLDSNEMDVVGKILDKNNIEYTTQKKVKTYCCDFYLPTLNLILEIDGYAKSAKRKQTIVNEGYNLLHVWNKDIEDIISKIVEVN